MFIIQDWCGNHCFKQKCFNTFDEAWSFLMKQFKNDTDLEEFEVIEIEE